MPEHVTLTARAILFDMDGTLVDSTAVVVEIWTRFARRFGLDPAVIMHSIHGVRAEDSVARFAPAGSDVATIVHELNSFELENTEGTVEIAGARDFVASLPRASVALVTSASTALAAGRLLGAGVPAPDVVVPAEHVTRGKPAPDGYLLAAQQLGVQPRDAIVFEDAEAGILAGIAAGMRVVVVGEHRSATTEGLPRIRDYRGAGATADAEGTITLTLPAA
ncbi:HAD-IA family hydrolase [Microbacteriaceae bacterium VKM Ac-2855]|nr:HAD-IA family hydrolase [Microbacteriaceae bacterium VKM Ac-2855]